MRFIFLIVGQIELILTIVDDLAVYYLAPSDGSDLNHAGVRNASVLPRNSTASPPNTRSSFSKEASKDTVTGDKHNFDCDFDRDVA